MILARLRTLITAERGSGGTSLFLAVMFVPLMLLGVGLAIDGSSKMDARRQATLVAGEAARAAGQALDPDAVTGTYRGVDPARGAAAARAYLTAAGVDGTVAVSGERVTVTTRIPWTPRFLPLGAETITDTRTIQTIRS